MVNLCARLCEFFTRKKNEQKDQDITDLVNILKKAIPQMEQNLDLKIAISELEARLGVRKAYAGVM